MSSTGRISDAEALELLEGGDLLGDPFGSGLPHGVEQGAIVRAGIGGRGSVELGGVEWIRHRRGLP